MISDEGECLGLHVEPADKTNVIYRNSFKAHIAHQECHPVSFLD